MAGYINIGPDGKPLSNENSIFLQAGGNPIFNRLDPSYEKTNFR